MRAGKTSRTPARRLTRALAGAFGTIGTLVLCACATHAGRVAEPAPAPVLLDPAAIRFSPLFDPVQPLDLSIDPEETESPRGVSFLKELQYDDVGFSGFLASRADDGAADYRLYLGMNYMRDLGEGAHLSGRTFYDSGTYDGVNPDGGTLPDYVRKSGDPLGGWVGADWQISSRLFDRHTFFAGIQYRQQVGSGFLNLGELLGRPAAPQERVGPQLGLVTRSEFSLSPELSLKLRMRLDEAAGTAGGSMDPRVELLYKPHSNATIRALFDQTDGALPSPERGYYPTVNLATDSDHVRNFELAYELSLPHRQQLRLSAYRYGVNGLLASAADADLTSPDPGAEIDTTGFELRMERRMAGGARARISYAWLETTDWIDGTSHGTLGRRLTGLSMNVPLLSNRLSTAFELQYLDVISPFFGNGERDFLIGNLTLASSRLAPATSLSIGIQNLFDAREEVSPEVPLLPFLPQEGRTVRVEVSRKL